MLIKKGDKVEMEIGDMIDEDNEIYIDIEQRNSFSCIYINKDDAKKMINHLQRVFDIKWE